MKNFQHLETHHIHELSNKAELVKLMRETLIARPEQEDLSPPRFAFGHFHQLGVMPEMSRNNPLVLQTKIVSLNSGSGHEGMVFRFEAKSGKLIAIISGKIFTSYRTAASSVAIAQKLKPNAKEIHFYGTGEQALRHIEFFSEFYPTAKLVVIGRNQNSLETLKKQLGTKSSSYIFTEKTPPRTAEIICTLSASPSPLLTLNEVNPNALILAIGSCHPSRRELSTDLVMAASRYVDSVPQMKREAGDYIIAARENNSDIHSFSTEIGKLLRDEVTLPHGILIYKSLGLAEQDIAFADYLLEKAS